jgi:hypothetical protein
MALQQPKQQQRVRCKQSCRKSHTHNEVLLILVRRLALLLPSAHEPTTRNNIFFNVGKVDLDHEAFLASVWVAHLGDAIARATNFEKDLPLDRVRTGGSNHELGLLHVARRTTGEVRLMLLALRVREVGAFIGVQC